MEQFFTAKWADSLNHPREHVSPLPPTDFHHCQQPLDKPAVS